MAVTEGSEYSYVDLKSKETQDVVRHKFKDSTARQGVSDLSASVETVQAGLNATGNDLLMEDNKLYLARNNGQTMNAIGDGVELNTGLTFDSGYVDENGMMHLQKSGTDISGFTPFQLPVGGGADGYRARIKNGLSSSYVSVASSQRVFLPFTYIEYFGQELVEDGKGRLTIQYKLSTETAYTTYSQYENKEISPNVQQNIEVTDLIGREDQQKTNVLIIVNNGRTGSDSVTTTLEFIVTNYVISISSSFNQDSTYTGNFSIPYICVGRNINKTLCCDIDGNEYAREDIGTSNNNPSSLPIEISGNYTYGAHLLELWFETDEGAKSNVLKYVILYNDGQGSGPIVGAYLTNDTIENGESLILNYICNTPGQDYTDSISIRVYSYDNGTEVEHYKDTLTNVQNNRIKTLPINNYPALGEGYIEIISGSAYQLITFTITEMTTDYNIEQVKEGLIFEYKPVGFTNNSDNRNSYTYTFKDASNAQKEVHVSMDNFNWVTDGYVDGESLTISGSGRVNVDLAPLSNTYYDKNNELVILDSSEEPKVITNGRTIEFEFEITNVVDPNATVFSCVNSNGVGFKITPQICYLLHRGQSIDIDSNGFILNEEKMICAYVKDDKRIRVSFVVDSQQTGCSNIYINGEYAKSLFYDSGAEYESNATITIGSDGCTTKLYEIRAYNVGLNHTQVLRNYMNSSVNLRNRITKNEYNDVLGDDGKISYKKAKVRYPCLLLIGELSPYKGAKKSCAAVLTKPDGKGSFVTEFALLDQDKNKNFVCENNVQGTSSQRYMRKNYKVKLAKNVVEEDENGNEVITGTTKVKYALKGKDENGYDLSIPESTLCFKMDYMSTDHANTFNANIADTLFTDKATVFAGQSNPEIIQNTIWGFRCLLFHMNQAKYKEGIDFERYADNDIEFAGDGCLNNDKSNVDSFGLKTKNYDSGAVTKQQKWEFKDNSQPICKFETDRLMEKDYIYDPTTQTTTMKRKVRYALESCYPDEGDLDDANIEPVYDYIQVLYTWVTKRANFWNASTDKIASESNYYSYTYTETYDDNGTERTRTVTDKYDNERDYRKAIFIKEFPLHFNKEHALVYYLFTEWVALSDNRGKNMFLSCKDVTAEHIVFKDGSTSIWDIVNDDTGVVDESKIDWENSTFGIWFCDLYDLDSCFGVENSGIITIPYYADWDYTLNGKHQFNSYESIFWLMFEEAMSAEIKKRAQKLTASNDGHGALNYTTLRQYHITGNAELVCQAIVNHDMNFKYNDPWTEGYINYEEEDANGEHPFVHDKQYKYLQRGSRTEQKESFIYKRSNMLYSKYQCDQFNTNQIRFRCNRNVPIGAHIDVTAVQSLYPGIQFGDSGTLIQHEKIAVGETAIIEAPKQTPPPGAEIDSDLYSVGRSDHIYIKGASMLTSISDLSQFEPYDLDFSRAEKLKVLLIGSDAEGYSNTMLTALNGLGNCSLLETLNIQNCEALSGAVDFTPSDTTKGNPLIRNVYAKGAKNVTEFRFNNGGILETLEIENPEIIDLQNQTYMRNFSCVSYKNLRKLRVENTPNIDVFAILKDCLPQLDSGVRLIGVSKTIEDDGEAKEFLNWLLSPDFQGKQLNANGYLIKDPAAWPVITGDIYCTRVGKNIKARVNEKYPNLVIHGTEFDEFAVEFYNPDDTPVRDRFGNPYIQYVDAGGDVYDPLDPRFNEIDTPEMQSDGQYVYTYDHWSYYDANNNLVVGLPTHVFNAGVKVYAQYTRVEMTYTVRWFVEEGDADPYDVQYNVKYGSDVQCSKPLPTSNKNGSYNVFLGWNKSTGYIKDNTDVYARWDRGGLPTQGTALKDMTISQIYAISKQKAAGSYLSNLNNYDYVDIDVGADFNYDNVDSQMLFENKFFDGSEVIDTGINLYNKSFTLALDYEFYSQTQGDVLAQCFDYNSGNPKGFQFRLNTGGAPAIYNGTNDLICGSGAYRNMMVIRYNNRTKTLVRYWSNFNQSVYNADIVDDNSTRTLNGMPENSTLTFGSIYSSVDNEGNITYRQLGWIHWGKIWFEDLGATDSKKLANWIHETWRMEYIGPNRYKINGTDEYCAASFMSRALLNWNSGISPYANSAGWSNSPARSFMNNRCFAALPIEWQYMVKTVDITTYQSASNPILTTTADQMYLPAYIEVRSPDQYGNISAAQQYKDEGETVPFYPNTTGSDIARTKWKGIIIPYDRTYYSSSQYPQEPTYVGVSVKDGDIWYRNGYYVYIRDWNKHRYINGGTVNSNYIVANDGGRWFNASEWHLRSPSATSNTSHHFITTSGSISSWSSSGTVNDGLLPCFSI